MGPALRGRNEVHIGLCRDLATLGQPLNSPIDGLCLTGKCIRKGLFRNDHVIDGGVGEVVRDSVLKIPLLLFAFLLIGQCDAKTGTQNSLGTKCVNKPRHCKNGCVKECLVWHEAYASTCVALATLTCDGQVFDFVTVFKSHRVDVTVSTNRDVQALRKRVDD